MAATMILTAPTGPAGSWPARRLTPAVHVREDQRWRRRFNVVATQNSMT
jgi:hypothetical protein